MAIHSETNNKLLQAKNIAFIDGQNLHLGLDCELDYERFRVYLRDKFNVDKAYYFLGYTNDIYQSLYTRLQEAGFIVCFKKHNEFLASKKKGNVDTDVVFEVMKNLIEKATTFEKILIVSGDGDYKRMIAYLIKKNRFQRILFPNRSNASSLYKKFSPHLYLDLSQGSLRNKLEHKKKKKSP